MKPLKISAYTTTNALGHGVKASFQALQNRTTGLRPCDFPGVDFDTWVGRIESLEDMRISGKLKTFDCRNNRLAQLGLQQDDFIPRVNQAIRQYGANRIGVFIGTSTSGIQQAEVAYQTRDPQTQALPADFHYAHTLNMYSTANFIRRYLNLQGPAQVVSTACSSSAKVFGCAHRFMTAGLCDAALVGGVDTLCLTTLYGFNSLELVSHQPCRPSDRDRDGLSIGEATGFALLEWPLETNMELGLLGYGESNDAYHISAPHPEGKGATLAMTQALNQAHLSANEVDYLNLHGTGTPANDRTEDLAVTQVLGTRVPCSSTKGWTGHTLGASGITEAVFACLSIEHNFMPGTLNTQVLDPALKSNILLDNLEKPVSRVVTNSFGFGGNNCTLIVGRLG
jgi:3-oxoacyl-[acyl-carrier-protein] synthase-1